jgi:hypothetical protein
MIQDTVAARDDHEHKAKTGAPLLCNMRTHEVETLYQTLWNILDWSVTSSANVNPFHNNILRAPRSTNKTTKTNSVALSPQANYTD